jgi:predicted transcriptional regulator
MATTAVILSIQPKHAENIFCGTKTVELRRRCPKQLAKGTLVLVYVTHPTRSLAGAFKVVRVVEKPLAELWNLVRKKAAISYQEFKEYYSGVRTGTAIFFYKVRSFPEPVLLDDLRRELVNFLPPQAFRYAKERELQAPIIAKLLSVME